ncbi:transglycosylase-like protein with SLT domain [Rhodobacter sp. JA431]|uniref:lytic transglycosylase domain-containing protein n=1 Tax=Rhodobacter sp. JA431 TaxID=570013 RepID=UPI000BDD7A50|nr:transglycosylase-like protein with SLT domain [Rhodobacter sp. JA431]
MKTKAVTIGLGLMLALAPVATDVAQADGLVLGRKSTKSQSLVRASQFALLDGRLSGQYSNSTRLRPDAPKGGDEAASTPRYSGRYKGEYLGHAKAAAARHGIPEDLFLRLVQQESGWNPGAVSPKGARGLAQLMPGTAAKLGVDAADPVQNLEGGARYLRMMYDRFGNWRLALAAYNAGPEAVEKHGGVPPYTETKNYVRIIYGS